MLDDYSIEEQAGSTAVMDINVQLDGKDVPQPFDMVKIIEEPELITDNLLEKGTATDTEVTGGTLSLKKRERTPYSQLFGLKWEDLF